MIELSEDALICDLAETYQILDYRSLPLRLVATLSAGLRDDSRIKLLAAEAPASMEILTLTTIADNLTLLRHGFSDSNAKPFLFTDILVGEHKKKKVTSFNTVDEFEAALSQIRGS